MLNITEIDGNNLYESAEEAAANDAKNLKSLGSGNTKYPTEYDPSVLERFPNPNPGSDDLVGLDCFEFRSLCVSGDTMIDVCRDESRYPDGIPIRDLVGTEGYVFSFDTKTNSPVVRKYKDVRMTRKNAEVVKVIMKYRHNCTVGEPEYTTSEITCTPDHMFLVRKGFRDSEWVKAIDLKPDMRLVASQKSQDTIRGLSRHRLIGEALFDEDLQHIHHKDGNHFNNSSDNLMNMSQHDHLSYHRKDEYGYDSSLDVHHLVELYESGLGFSDLATMFNCDSSTIETRIGKLVKKRTQQEELTIRNKNINKSRDEEICELYQKGYTSNEISEYFSIHSTTVLQALRRYNIEIRESNYSRYLRRGLDLPPLNHKVVTVVPAGTQDVYNMEVEDTECFFANDIVIHNCPLTHQPDLATIHISYIPNKWMVESKSIKLYLFSYANHGAFHERCVHTIMEDLVKLLEPKYLEVYGDFNSRGGVCILPFAQYANDEYHEFKKERKLQMISMFTAHKPRH